MFKKLIGILTTWVLILYNAYGFEVLDSVSFNTLYDSSRFYNNLQNFDRALNLLNLLQARIDTNSSYQISKLSKIYNRLGIIHRSLGNYDKSKIFYNKAFKATNDSSYKALVFMNMGALMSEQGEIGEAIIYYENAIIYCKTNDKYNVLESAYYNLGYAYLKVRHWQKVIFFTRKSLKIKSDLNERYIGFSYLNLAISYKNLNFSDTARYYFILAIKSFEKTFGAGHYNTAFGYMDYADFLIETGEYRKSKYYLDKAYEIFLKTYGNKSMYTANCLYNMGKLAFAKADYPGALAYFHKALIAKINDFNNIDIYAFLRQQLIPDLALIDIFNHKSLAFERLAETRGKKKNLEAALQSIEQSASIIERLRKGYLTEVSKLQLTGNENQVYNSGLRLSAGLYKLTGNKAYLEKAFQYSERSRYGILRELRGNIAAQSYAGIPDSLAEKDRYLSLNIEGCQAMIKEENKQKVPDENLINTLNQKLFALVREQEQLIEYMEKNYPDFYRMKYSNEVVKIRDLQNFLNSSQALVEYSLQDSLIYIFLVTSDTFLVNLQKADTAFYNNLILYKSILHSHYSYRYSLYNKAAYSLYAKLILPVEKHLKGKELIIVPDGDLNRISFDAFLTSPEKSNPFNMYRDENYLLRKYPISYAFNATWLVQTKTKKFPFRRNFIGFAPDYTNSPDSLDPIPESLVSTQKISRMFIFGKAILGKKATERRFKYQNNYNILNLNVHGVEDTLIPALSRIFFTSVQNSLEDGYLYAYEVSNMVLGCNLSSIMACYSGSGRTVAGEGVLNIGRSFANAGCPSVLFSLWILYSETSNGIMEEFYRNIIFGNSKVRALQKAKLKYINNVRPYDANPQLWSGIVLYGNPNPIFTDFSRVVILSLVLLVLGIVGYIIFRKKLVKRL